PDTPVHGCGGGASSPAPPATFPISACSITRIGDLLEVLVHQGWPCRHPRRAGMPAAANQRTASRLQPCLYPFAPDVAPLGNFRTGVIRRLGRPGPGLSTHHLPDLSAFDLAHSCAPLG